MGSTDREVLSYQNRYNSHSTPTLFFPFIHSTYDFPTCDVGFIGDAYDYVMKADGVTLANLYPYEPMASRCDVTKSGYAVRETNWYRIIEEQVMIDYVLCGGTLSAVIDSRLMGSHKSGIVST